MTSFVSLTTQTDQTPSSAVAWRSAAQYAAALLHRGGVIALPTDTVYGLACLAQNKQALKKLFQIKERRKDKPIALCVGAVQEIAKYGKVDLKIIPILNSLLPGPVTLLFEAGPSMDKDGIANNHLVAIRIPDHPFTMQVAQLCNGAIALTSANKSREPSCLKVEEFKPLWSDLDAVFDGGRLGTIDPMRLGSTIVDLSIEASFKIIRNGCALNKVKKILAILQPFNDNGYPVAQRIQAIFGK
ncbi:L-threonylcarbamoyladenylate synthase [Cardinium endosymbiont of Bemisia tabaci]|uniref:L-threonylcarbamoyladenylate synthase n=1 Tax=Cardinium endosymbiont of Bemisia tabaci TaxID=672794 RepID=UPI000442D2DF|nr:L-threonylcarbamoyladenylate synthase [Cardinium endosymbiont of Bemisia tabaci]CDG49361.1 Putative ribosome maturation factor rimN [Cardinium endosymbiont cBtQ1 of Bemisia tabaci]